MTDLYSSTVDCDNGRASIEQMDAVFQALPAAVQAQFKSAHDAIMSTFQSTWYFGINMIPFNPECGTIANLGQQAGQLTAQMQKAIGQTPSAGLMPSGNALSPYVVLGIVVLVIVIVGSHELEKFL